MALPCGCVGECVGHAAPLAVPPGTLHAPSVLDSVARGCVGFLEEKLNLPKGALYNRGVGDIVRASIAENPNIPQNPLTAVDLARRAGILGEKRPKHRRVR